GGERNADLEIALLAVGEIGGELVRLRPEADSLEHRFGLFDDVEISAVVPQHAPAMPARLRGDADVLERRGVGQDIGDLVGAGDALRGDEVGGKPGDILAVEHNSPRRGTKDAGETVEEGALARAVRPDDGANFATPNFEIDTIERGQSAEADGQALGAQNR